MGYTFSFEAITIYIIWKAKYIYEKNFHLMSWYKLFYCDYNSVQYTLERALNTKNKNVPVILNHAKNMHKAGQFHTILTFKHMHRSYKFHALLYIWSKTTQ